MRIVNIPKDEHGRRQLHCQCGQALLVYLKYLHGDGNCLKWYCVQPLGAADPHSLWLEHCPACGVAFGYPPPLQEQVSMSESELATGGVIENPPLMSSEQGEEFVAWSPWMNGVRVGVGNVTLNPNPTLLSPGGPAFTGYVGDVPWQYVPPPAPWTPVVVQQPSHTLTEDDIRALVAKWLREDPDIRAILSGAVDERLDELARELKTRAAFQPGTWRMDEAEQTTAPTERRIKSNGT